MPPVPLYILYLLATLNVLAQLRMQCNAANQSSVGRMLVSVRDASNLKRMAMFLRLYCFQRECIKAQEGGKSHSHMNGKLHCNPKTCVIHKEILVNNMKISTIKTSE